MYKSYNGKGQSNWAISGIDVSIEDFKAALSDRLQKKTYIYNIFSIKQKLIHMYGYDVKLEEFTGLKKIFKEYAGTINQKYISKI